jgi:hypothetical protein
MKLQIFHRQLIIELKKNYSKLPRSGPHFWAICDQVDQKIRYWEIQDPSLRRILRVNMLASLYPGLSAIYCRDWVAHAWKGNGAELPNR